MNNTDFAPGHEFLNDLGQVECWSHAVGRDDRAYLMRNSKKAELPGCCSCHVEIPPYCTFIVLQLQGETKLRMLYCRDCVLEKRTEAFYEPFKENVRATTCLKNAPCYIVHMTRGI